MNWTRYKLLFISGAVAVVVCGGLLFWILSGSSAAADLEASIQSLQQQQNRLTSAKPYPSPANLKALKEEQQKVRERRDAIQRAIQEGQISPQRVNRSVFGDYIRGIVPQLRQKAAQAKKGGENGVILRDPDFGLSEYLEGALPSQNRIDSLVVEVEALSHVAGVLFESGISELISISVEPKADPEAAARGTLPIPGPGRGGPPGTAGRVPGLAAPEDGRSDIEREKERMFETLTLKVEFKAYEDFLWQTMNTLLADPNQIAISTLSITNSNTLLWPDYLKNPGSGTGTGRSRQPRRPEPRRAAPANDLLSMLSGGNPEASAPSHPEVEKQAGLNDRRINRVGGDLLHVVVELKIFRLKSEDSETQPEGV